MKYYIGADLGTSTFKLLLVDSCGKIVKTATRSYSVQYPQPAWSEQNPEDWWNAFLSGVKECANAFVKIKKTITPDADISLRYEKQYEKFKEIYPTLKNLFKIIK